LTEVGRWAYVDQLSAEPTRTGRDSRPLRGARVVRFVRERLNLAEDRGSFVKRRKFLPGDGPATVGNPVTLLEVDFVERAAPTAPAVGRSAEKPVLRQTQVVLGGRKTPGAAVHNRAVHAAVGESMGLDVVLDPSALQQDYRNLLVREFQCNGDARGARAHD